MTTTDDMTTTATKRAVRIGVGGPVGSGKTMLVRRIIEALQSTIRIGVVTNDIYTKEDAEFLTKLGILPQSHILGVETGGCPHSAIRDDVSMNLAAIDELTHQCGDELDLILVESGGDNLTAMFSPDLADKTIYVIDVAQGDKIPRKGGPGLTYSDLLIINKISLAPFVGANLNVMERDAKALRGDGSTIFSDLGDGRGIEEISRWILEQLN
ncbi:MAG: urease accessory protein UreG [Actinomycetota bacterium]|nr:urease accessory protein UreG [Actinomycetota bacterium]